MIYVVSELYYPEETSTGYILTKIAEGLAETLSVQVITGPPDYSGRKIAAKSEVRNGVKIDRVRTIKLNKNKLASRFFRSILLSLQLAFKTWAKVRRGDTVFVVTNPAPLLIIMSIICRLTHSSLIILTHDVFPENLQAAKLLKKESLFSRALAQIFNSVYKTADHIIVIGRDMKEIMLRKINSRHPEITVITNWADTADIHPEARATNAIVNKLNLHDRFIVQFAGNIGRVQGIDQIVDAAEILKEERIHFLFVGDGTHKQWLVKQIQKRGLGNITLLDQMPRVEQQIFLNACDVGIVSLAQGMLGLGVPSKAYNILAAGKPLIAIVDSESEVGYLVKEENVGWLVAPGDPDQLASAILEASRFATLAEMGRKARELAESKYSFIAINERYRSVFGSYESSR